MASFETLTGAQSLEGVARIAESGIKFDAWWIDAGWTKIFNNSWLYGLGDWNPDPARYPSGMRPISDAAHKAGMGSAVWFEPERLSAGSSNLSNFRAGDPSKIVTLANDPSSHPDVFTLLNLSEDSTRDWIIDLVSNRIRDFGVDIYRQDMNVNKIFRYW